jgi:hypothetical protein
VCNCVGTLKMNETGLRRQRLRINFNFILLLNLYSQTAGKGNSTQFEESPSFGKKYCSNILQVFYMFLCSTLLNSFDVSTSYISFDRGTAREKCDVTARA